MNGEFFDAIIVGSGFGGSVMAYRLAEAGLRVLVLERGKPYAPGSFPRTPHAVKRNFWDPPAGLHGLYDVRTFPHLVAVTASGLGGGSLIYANVALRKEDRWFVDEDPITGTVTPWPVDRAALDPHYDRVEAMLRPTPFPLGGAPHLRTPRATALDEAARRLGLSVQQPPLAIAFSAREGAPPTAGDVVHEAVPNLHGVQRRTCKACAECCVGCNEGSKSSLDLTYLSHAKHHGAEIRTRCEVRGLAHVDGGGYAVTYIEHLAEREGTPTSLADLPLRTVSARVVVLAAGTFGSTEILLRNRDTLGRFGDMLGARFSSNGDRIAFVERAENADGTTRLLEPTVGPVITTSIRVPGKRGAPGFLVQDAGAPVAWAWAAEATQVRGEVAQVARFARRVLARALGLDRGSPIDALFPDGAFSASALPLLAMGEDVPSGRMVLRGDRLALEWSEDASRLLYERMREVEQWIAEELGGELHENPLSLAGRAVTSHPLGGCAMAHHPHAGVVDPQGEVFGHPGLFVADGAVMPGPTGDNPSLTIAALADRFADHVVARYGRHRVPASPTPARRPAAAMSAFMADGAEE